jgi:hypothetical protein
LQEIDLKLSLPLTSTAEALAVPNESVSTRQSNSATTFLNFFIKQALLSYV